jgi:paraquat-inducible protein A
LLAAAICYVPANTLPIMTVSYFGKGEPSTIMSGVIDLVNNGMVPIAVVVFVASIVVPTFKLIGLAWLLISVQRKRAIRARQRMFLFRFIQWIGRWSMLDIFVISILVTLVDFGNFASVEANPGAIAFAAVVIFTMLAAKTFDPRLIWDHTCPEEKDE